MKWKIVLIGGLALLAGGCANDNYAAIHGAQPAVPMSVALKGCKDEALTAYTTGHYNGAGLAGAVFGGAIGGAVGGVIDANSGKMTAGDIDPAIERCMAAKGYVGTSEN